MESLANNFIVTITAFTSIEEAQYRFLVYVVVRERFSIISRVYTVKLNMGLNLNKIKQARRKYKWDKHHVFITKIFIQNSACVYHKPKKSHHMDKKTGAMQYKYPITSNRNTSKRPKRCLGRWGMAAPES